MNRIKYDNAYTGGRMDAGNRNTRAVGQRVCDIIQASNADIVFLLEILSDAAYISSSLVRCLSGQGGTAATWGSDFSHVGVAGQRQERVIVLYHSTNVTPLRLEEIGVLDRRTADSSTGFIVRPAGAIRSDESTIREAGPENYGTSRVPLIATFTIGANREYTMKLAAYHSLGPAPYNDNTAIWTGMRQSLRTNNVGVALGDFNFQIDGDVPCLSGTSLGGRHYDRAISLGLNGYTVGDQTCGNTVDLSDHKPVFVNVTKSRD